MDGRQEETKGSWGRREQSRQAGGRRGESHGHDQREKLHEGQGCALGVETGWLV